VRPVSLLVDITQYVMLELGQPMHAYDLGTLQGSIAVRRSRTGETLKLLDGRDAALDDGFLVITDADRPVGLAGIMGGHDTRVTDDTTAVFLEAAHFAPAAIMGRGRKLGLHTDAGHRFERGVDPALPRTAIEYATRLVLDLAGGTPAPVTEAVRESDLPATATIGLRRARIARVLGIQIADADVERILRALGMDVAAAADGWQVTAPSRRFDIAIEEDLIEELARIHGYERIPAAPSAHVQHMLPAPEGARALAALKGRLVDRDWQEVITFSFVPKVVERALDPQAAPVGVQNPIAGHLDVMRTTLLPGLIEVLRTNASRKAPRVRIFETGRVFHGPAIDAQPLRVGGLAYGPALPEQWGEKTRAVDFFDVKGDLEALAAPLSLATPRAVRPWLHPGRAASVVIAGREAGWIGELHPRLTRELDLPGTSVVFELALDALTDVSVPQARPVSRLPFVRRDLAVVLDEAIPVQDVVDALQGARVPYVDSVRPFDVYRGPGLPSARKSLAILVLIGDTERTLTDVEIEGAVDALRRILTDRFGAEQRQ
jgi:phenylalanyl-tRNA synthetase beta chain